MTAMAQLGTGGPSAFQAMKDRLVQLINAGSPAPGAVEIDNKKANRAALAAQLRAAGA